MTSGSDSGQVSVARRSPRLARRGVSRLARIIKPALVRTIWSLNYAIRRFSAQSHRLQSWIEWSVGTSPEWYDHELGVQWRMDADRNANFMHRGFLGSVSLAPNGRVLVLCSGDGFHARNCFSGLASEVFCIDADPVAVGFAGRYHSAPNLTFTNGDVTRDMPEGPFDLITWDQAIEHFDEQEIDSVMHNICSRLAPAGVLTGSTVVKGSIDEAHHSPYHEHEFATKEELFSQLHAHFAHVIVFETATRDRGELYFCASQSVDSLPFTRGNSRFLMSTPN